MVAIFTGILIANNAIETPSRLRVEPQKEREPCVPTWPLTMPIVPTAPIPSTPMTPVTYADVAHRKPCHKHDPTQLAAHETTHASLEALQPAAAPSLPADKPNPH